METSPVTSVKISSVVPASITGENKQRHLTAMDLAMKLHYIQAVYFFKGTKTTRGAEGFTITTDLKTTMFALLQLKCYHHVSGRIRMPDGNEKDSSRLPFIRCNDSGIRIVEANVEEFTVEEWLRLENRSVDHRFLVHDHVLGPDLSFSPLVFLQITQFKCGGFSIGLSWAHILGDIFSASTFMNTIGQLMSGHAPPKSVYPETSKITPQAYDSDGDEAISTKKIESVGEFWLLNNKCKMGRFNFNISLDQIDRLVTKYSGFSEVDILCAAIWKSLLNIHGKSDTNVITFIDRKNSLICSNDDLIISVVEKKNEMIGISELATLIASEKREENGLVKQMIEKDRGISDFITYGSNLTFVNLDMINMSEFEINGAKPDFVNYTIHGVEEKGVVLVYPKGKFRRIVSVVMPEEELPKLKDEVINMII